MLLLLEQCKDAPKCELIEMLMARRSDQDHVKVRFEKERKSFFKKKRKLFFFQAYISSCLSDLDHEVACAESLDWMSLFVGNLDQPVPAARAVKVEGSVCSTLAQAKAGIQEQVSQGKEQTVYFD